MRLADKTVLISGAGSGMGRLACQLFAREGARIVAVDLAEAPLRETAASVESEGGGIVAVVANVSSAADVERAVAEGVRAFGGLHRPPGRLHRLQGRSALPYPLARRAVRPPGRARQRDLPRAGPDADAGVALPERGGAAEAAESHPDGPLRPGGGRGLRRALPRLRRVVVDHRYDLRGGRRHQRELLLRALATYRPGSKDSRLRPGGSPEALALSLPVQLPLPLP